MAAHRPRPKASTRDEEVTYGQRGANNQYVVSVRLHKDEYARFWRYCHVTGRNFNSALRHLINTHEETK